MPVGAYLRFLLATASWFLAWGLQVMLLPWLVVDQLRESPERVGLAQALSLLPSVPFLLLGGALGDRLEPRRMVFAVHCALALLVASLAALVAAGELAYGRLLLFAFAAGALNALQVPSRDAQLYAITRDRISRGVVGTNLVTNAGQAIGSLLGASLAALGAPVVLAVQAGLALAGALPVATLRTERAPQEPAARAALAGIGEAIAVAARSPVIGPVFLLTSAVGLLFVGPANVVLPLLVRDVYGGGPREIGLLASMLPLGGIVGGAVLFARGGLQRNGRALLLGQAAAALAIGSLAFTLPFAGAALAVFAWGVASAFFLAAGRTLFHVAAPEDKRARLLGLYALGILGAGPLGSLLSGALVGAVGPHRALALQAAAMLAAVAAVARGTAIARL